MGTVAKPAWKPWLAGPALSVLLLLHAVPAGAEAFGEGESFAHSQAVSDSELSGMRGGFIGIGGLKIDFALTTRTLIDGIVQSSVSLNSSGLGLAPAELQQIVQVGSGNTAAALDLIANNPAVLNVIQNTDNGTLIQNLNVLDLTVGNLQAFHLQTQTLPQLDFRNIESLR